MSKIKFKLYKKGVRELLKSQGMMDVCNEYASEALSRLDDGYEINQRTGSNRVNVEIMAVSEKAQQDNLDNNSLLKAVQK